MDKKITVEDLNMKIEESIKVMNNFIKNNQEKIGKERDEIIKNMLALINDFSIVYTNCITDINKKFQNFETNEGSKNEPGFENEEKNEKLKEIYIKKEFDKNYYDEFHCCRFCGYEFDSFESMYEFVNTWDGDNHVLCEECFKGLKIQINRE
jgi:hypothetical protein